ncbi:MAG TPA: winged helix-turn-helix domain-containing protein [Caulobacter sp.]|nr:winged helix-turn-helix domain-containing protein [Caulobacter sp.]
MSYAASTGPGSLLGRQNRAAVLALLHTHPGITNVEISARLGLSPVSVGRHVKTLRSRWPLNLIEREQVGETLTPRQEAAFALFQQLGADDPLRAALSARFGWTDCPACDRAYHEDWGAICPSCSGAD